MLVFRGITFDEYLLLYKADYLFYNNLNLKILSDAKHAPDQEIV
jgi:hypothetical protein